MSNLNPSDTERRVESFQSRLRAECAAKIQEVAKMTDVVAKLQTQLLDVEHENNVLRQQLVIANMKISQLEGKGTATARKKKGKLSELAADTSVEVIPSLKRERSPSLGLVDIPQPPLKKARVKDREEHSASLMDVVPEGVIIGSEPIQRANVLPPTPSPDTSDITKATVADSQSLDSASPASTDNGLKPSLSEPVYNEDVFSLPRSTADQFFQSIQVLDIYPPPSDLEVSRSFLRRAYGCGRGQFLPYSKKNSSSGQLELPVAFLDAFLHPLVPTRPGDPGLLLGFPAQRLDVRHPWVLFTGHMCRYLGEYKFTQAGKMNAQCFRMQSDNAKRRWAEQLLHATSSGYYRIVRARIALRLASIFSKTNKRKAKRKRLIKEEVSKIKKGCGRQISEQDIINAFENGEERIDIFSMQCIKYDHAFANDLKARFSKHGTAKNVHGNADSGDEEGDDDEEDAESGDDDKKPQTSTSVSKERNTANVQALMNALQAGKPTRPPARHENPERFDSECSSDSSGSSNSDSESD